MNLMGSQMHESSQDQLEHSHQRGLGAAKSILGKAAVVVRFQGQFLGTSRAQYVARPPVASNVNAVVKLASLLATMACFW